MVRLIDKVVAALGRTSVKVVVKPGNLNDDWFFDIPIWNALLAVDRMPHVDLDRRCEK